MRLKQVLGMRFQAIINRATITGLDAFKPQLVMISARFECAQRRPMATT